MPRSARVPTAAGLAGACGLGMLWGRSEDAFVAPRVGEQGALWPQQLEASRAVAGNPRATAARGPLEGSGALTAAGATAAAGLLLRQALAGRRSSKARASDAAMVPRHFFGGDSGPAYKAFDPSTELGVQEPLGFWDPLGFSSDNDEAAFKRRRSVELKHGRVSMAATIGYIVPEYYKFPGMLSPSQGVAFQDVPNGLAALSKVPGLGWVQIIFFAGIVEGAFGVTNDYKKGTPGDYGWKVITSADPAEKDKKLAAELANGRLAMVAIIGMFFQDGLTGSAWGDWALYTASPLRAEPVSAAAAAAAATKAAAAGKAATKTAVAVGAAAGAGSLTKGGTEGVAGTDKPSATFDPAQQLGAMPPLGYFDPAGFCKKGDESGFRTFRAAELKHGRVAMMAAVGGVAQHYIKFPGFEAVPSGLSAVLTPPGSYGMAALFLLAGALELGAWTEDPSKEPGNFGDPLGLGQYDMEMRARELNNGRFAMFAALGIISAELLTGKDAVEQFGL